MFTLMTTATRVRSDMQEVQVDTDLFCQRAQVMIQCADGKVAGHTFADRKGQVHRRIVFSLTYKISNIF